MRTLAAAALAGLALVPSAGGSGGEWGALYRPLALPQIAPGTPCPVSKVDRSVDFARFRMGPGIGPGPAYPVGMLVSVLPIAPPENFESRNWGGQKVLWVVHPRYRGPVLIRGRRLDGPDLVRFERGDVPPAELRIERTTSDGVTDPGRGRPSFTRLRRPGCYGYQIDGTTFSRVIVFRAVGNI